MAATGGRPVTDLTGCNGTARHGPFTVEERLFREGHAFEFFQAVRLLGRLDAGRRPVGHAAAPHVESVRFRAHLSLEFPASQIYEIRPPDPGQPLPLMTVTFMGLTGPLGVLPRHYTELLLRQERDVRGPDRYALRAWFDLFNHRLITLFYRAWEKYRFPVSYERVHATQAIPPRSGLGTQPGGQHEPDPFTQSLFCLVGLGMPSLRNRLCVSVPEPQRGGPEDRRVLARIDDLALLHYGGLLAQRPRTSAGLEAILGDFFGLEVQVRQFQGQWLRLEPVNQSRLGVEEGNNALGLNVVAGVRVWNVQSKVRLRVGPLRYGRFNEFLPDPAPAARRKAFFLLVQLVRLYLGPELDFDVQLVLCAPDIRTCRLGDGEGGARLGWNSWLCSQPATGDSEDAVFAGEDMDWFAHTGEPGAT